MYLLLTLFASTALPAVLPDSVLFHDSPATMEQMRAIEGEWVTSRRVPAMTISSVQPGWMSLKVGKGLMDWVDHNASFPVPVTTHNGQLFINIAVRFVLPEWAYKREYQGKECYGVAAVVNVGDKIELFDFDEDRMRAANSWYPKVMPAWEGKQTSCGDLVIRAEAAVDQRVAVILDQSRFDGPFHRISQKHRHASGLAFERSR